jgi:rhomboid-like protein
MLSFISTDRMLICPSPSLSGAATGALVLVDLIGLIRGWKMFDHAAHLAGAAFGAGYWFIGHEWFEKLRVQLIKMRKRETAIQ